MPKGELCAIEKEEIKNGASHIQESAGGGKSEDVQGEVRPDGSGPSEEGADSGAGTASTETPGTRDSAGGDGLPDARFNAEDEGNDHETGPALETTEESLQNTAHAGLNPEKVLKAMQELDSNNAGHWTADGRPRIDGIERIMGGSGLTRKDIDAIWPELRRHGV